MWGGIYITNRKQQSVFVYAIDLAGNYLTHNTNLGAPCDRSPVFKNWLEIKPGTRGQWDSGPIMLKSETWTVFVQDERPDANSGPTNFKGNCFQLAIEDIATCNWHTNVTVFDDKIDIKQGERVVLNLAMSGIKLAINHGAPLLAPFIAGNIANSAPRPRP